jgi:hypothetical protein
MALSFINTSGNIISEDFCSQLLIETKADYVKSKSFGEDVKKIDEDIATSFELLRERWEEIRSKLLEDQFDTTQLRDRWIKPFLSLLGFDPVYNQHNLKNEAELEYNIPYRGWDSEEAPLIHMVHSSIDLDSRDKNNRTHPNKSPHDLLQQFLNTSPHSWAILINGRKIRVLRDFFHSITKGFIEFDIEGIFESANTEQFRILYRMLHNSRFIGQYDKKQENEIQQVCLLEKFHTLSRETGVKVGDNLRKQVRTSIETLGNGFAENLNPDDFDEAKVKKFYSEILNIIYRLLFLLFAEQKGWLPVKNDVYARTYSINSLRERAEKADHSHDNNEDLWEGLKVTFQLVTNGYTFPNGDSINAFGGQLFSDERIFHIKSPLKNKYLLKAIDALCFFTENKIKSKINYATLAIDELGSVYESLLDYEPRLLSESIEFNGRNCKRGEFILDDRSTERKTTGSYYTDSRLVAQLIDSALVPVIENALGEQTTNEEKKLALLDLKVADIACGSGAFLTAALEKLGEYLALIGKEEGEKPTEQELRQAKRDVLQNCIYGVDLNHMALELAKFSLWITASMPNLPLSFLDHKLKCGNSLIGATPELIEKGIPVEAYNPVTFDEPTVCTDLKKRVKKELEGLSRRDKGIQTGFEFKIPDFIIAEEESEQYQHILQSQQEDAEEVAALAEEYEVIYNALRENTDWKLADAWIASFFIQKDDINKIYPTNVVLQNIKQGDPIDEELETEILRLTHKYRFFHWHLEYPEVFEKGGFDCILGNPPWEKLQLEDKEFFSSYIPNYKNLKGQKKKRIIQSLLESNIKIKHDWELFQRNVKTLDNFIKKSIKYPLTGFGKLNLYSVFCENSLIISHKNSTIGLITPTGIVADYENKELFSSLIENNEIQNIYEFINEHRLFREVAPPQRFCLISLNRGKKEPETLISMGNKDVETVLNNVISINSDTIELLNPNTKTLPIFNSGTDLKINTRLYFNNRILQNENSENEFDISINRMINPTDDSDLFHTKEDLLEKIKYSKPYFSDNNTNYLPVLEAKQIHQYNHRYNTYEGIPVDKRFGTKPSTISSSVNNLSDKNYEIEPRYWISTNSFQKFIKDKSPVNWLICFRDITNVTTNRRTVIATIVPMWGIVDPLRCIYFINEESANLADKLLANLNCFVFDYMARQKVTGSHLAIFIFKQIPIIPLNRYSPRINSMIRKNVVHLVYTSNSMQEFAKYMGYNDTPYKWDEEERFRMECELNALFGHLYGVSYTELEYILETFPIVKRKDIEKYGIYRTKETILKLFEDMEWVKEEMGKVKN